MQFKKALKSVGKFKKAHTKLAVGVLIVLFCGWLANAFFYSGSSSTKLNPSSAVTIPSYGQLPALAQAMKKNRALHGEVQDLFALDVAYLFVNYREVNGMVANVLFHWSGITPAQLKNMQGDEAVQSFLRRVYALPDDEPIENNPLIGNRPWPVLFNRFKSRLLMMGHGREIYDGLNYYDSAADQMVVNNNLSEDFADAFIDFLQMQKADQKKRYLNNYLSFVGETKGFKDLTPDDKAIIQRMQDVVK